MEMSLPIREGEKDFIELARSFSRKSVMPLFDNESADGDLAQVPSVIDKAFEVGLASSPDDRMPGYEYGIWGYPLSEEVIRLSAMLLSVLSETCPGIAMSLHAQGLASSVITASGAQPAEPPIRVAAAFQEGYGLPGYGTLHDPACDGPDAVAATARATADGYVISGRKSFVYGMSGVGAFVVFCRMLDMGCWGCFLVPAAAEGVSIEEITGRTGLRSCGLMDLVLDNVVVPAHGRLDGGDAAALIRQAVCIHWLGLSAIGAGNARGALQAARKYASTRYQGGDLIENHPAVRKLIALSEARTEAAFALLLQAAGALSDPKACLKQCAVAKHMATDLSFGAVTDCLQVFGGYGYMEDYRMEKRLRDAMVLKSTGGTRNQLELFIFEAGKEA